MGQAVLASQPFSLLLGAELIKFSPEGTELRLPVSEQLKQQFGFIHGGVLAYLADNAMTFAGALSLGATAVATSEMKINYIRPALGGMLIARAAAMSAGRVQSVVRCEIYVVQDGEEKLCAAAQGTIVARDANAKSRCEAEDAPAR
jgi:uncharacterized protein (TIGR00369 family)